VTIISLLCECNATTKSFAGSSSSRGAHASASTQVMQSGRVPHNSATGEAQSAFLATRQKAAVNSCQLPSRAVQKHVCGERQGCRHCPHRRLTLYKARQALHSPVAVLSQRMHMWATTAAPPPGPGRQEGYRQGSVAVPGQAGHEQLLSCWMAGRLQKTG
jgi:hypothetical protein